MSAKITLLVIKIKILIKFGFLCCKLAGVVPSTLTQLTFALLELQHIFTFEAEL